MRKPSRSIPIKVMYWSSQISTISIEMALLIGLGYWADTRWNTSPWLLLSGCFAAVLLSFWQLFRLVRANRE